jgi:hypothetical protein
MRKLSLVILVVAMAPCVAAADSFPVLKHDPPAGSLASGQHVLVDDGSCPKGEIKEIVGGNNAGSGHHGTAPRITHCIRRPR